MYRPTGTVPDRPGLVERLGKTLLDWGLIPEEVAQAARRRARQPARPW